MENKNKTLVLVTGVGLVFALLGAGVGGYFGANMGAGLVLNNALQKDAISAQSHIKTLNDLRAGNVELAIENLEKHLEHEIIVFYPHEPYQNLEEKTLKDIEQAILSVENYREKIE